MDIYESIDISYPNAFDILEYRKCIDENLQGIRTVFQNSGMSEEKIKRIEEETDNFFIEYFEYEATRKYLKVDIQNEVSAFLDDYMLDSDVLLSVDKASEMLDYIQNELDKRGVHNGK